MLDKKVDEIVYDSNGRVCGVRSGDEVINNGDEDDYKIMVIFYFHIYLFT